MKVLYLLRHAKSSWGHEGLADFERPLNGRGRKTAKAVGRYMREQHIAPTLILCSSALRTRETLAAICGLIDARSVLFEDGLYEAAPKSLLRRLAEVAADVPSVLVIGHNPGLERLTEALIDTTAANDANAMEALEEKFPTGALAVLECGIDRWSKLGPATCRLARFVRPIDLESE